MVRRWTRHNQQAVASLQDKADLSAQTAEFGVILTMSVMIGQHILAQQLLPSLCFNKPACQPSQQPCYSQLPDGAG